MSFDINKNLRDKTSEQAGTWMDYDEGVQFLIARKTNSDYKAFMSKEYRKNEAALDPKVKTADNLKRANDLSEQLLLSALSKHILLDWRGIEADGKSMDYTEELGMKVLEEHEDLREDIEAYSEERSNYLLEKDAKDAKNLKK